MSAVTRAVGSGNDGFRVRGDRVLGTRDVRVAGIRSGGLIDGKVAAYVEEREIGK